jgi:diguanylate cyclase (GGDEF)-like protein
VSLETEGQRASEADSEEVSRRGDAQPPAASPLADEQDAADRDQVAADADQTAADSDQQSSEADQERSDADQRSSDRDQRSADRDQLDHPHDRDAYEATRADRKEQTAERRNATFERVIGTDDRDVQASVRDESAHRRDLAADQRERQADARDRVAVPAPDAEHPTPEAFSAALADVAAARAARAEAREAAAADRHRAADDRAQAAADRKRSSIALERAHLDELTGAYGRGMGETVLRNEVERAKRSRTLLVLAFVDVDGLKGINDREGHAAGDEALRMVVRAIQAKLRSYDPVVRMGGDEFVCTLSTDLVVAQTRFSEARASLASESRISFSVGFSELRPGDSLEDLMARGDSALYEAKRSR